MQTYVFEEKYSLMVFRWNTGYLSNNKLISFLKKPNKNLNSFVNRNPK